MMHFMLIAVRTVWFAFLMKGRVQPQLLSTVVPHSYVFLNLLYAKQSLEREQNEKEN